MLDTVTTIPDYHSQLSRAILMELRGSLSQMELSTKLGFTFNQVGKWESGATLFHWTDFVSVNEVLNIPWKSHFESIFSFHTGMKVESSSIFEILAQFFGDSSTQELATRLHKSRSSISRLLNEQVKLDFSDVLRLMDQRVFVLNSWLSKFINPQNIGILKERFQQESQMAKGLVAVPWSPLVNSCLTLQEYLELPAHSNEWIAQKTGLTSDQVKEALEKLVESGAATIRNGKYRSYVVDMTFLRMPEYRGVTRYLTQRCADVFSTQKPANPNYNNPSLSSSRVYPLSQEAGKKAAEALVAFHHQLTEIMKNDTGPKDHVRAVIVHSLDTQLLSPVSENETL